MAESLLDAITGGLLGVAAGDALGATVEFMTPEEIEEKYGVHREIIGGSDFKWRPGEGTDDTDLTWAVIRGYLETDGVESLDVRGLDRLRQGPVLADQPCRRTGPPPCDMTQQATAADPQATRPTRGRHRILVCHTAHHRVLEQAPSRGHPPIHRRRRRTTSRTKTNDPLARRRRRPGLPLQPIEHVRRHNLGPTDPGLVEEPGQAHHIERVPAHRRRREVPGLQMSQPPIPDLHQRYIAHQAVNPINPSHADHHRRLLQTAVSRDRINHRRTLSQSPTTTTARAG